MGKESAERIQTSILSKAEKKALVWLAQRQPEWMTSDTLTYIGVLGTVVYAIGGWLSNTDIRYLWLSSFGLVLHWYGDSLDGTLARFRNTQRPIRLFHRPYARRCHHLPHLPRRRSLSYVSYGCGVSSISRLFEPLHIHLRLHHRQRRILSDVRQTRSYRIPFTAHTFKHTLHVHIMVRMAYQLVWS